MNSINRKQRTGRNAKKNGKSTTTVNSSLLHQQAILPLTMTTSLQYVDSAITRNNPGNSFLVWGMRINDLYDPDPAILSGSISGYGELMAFYSTYRCISNHVEVTICNNEDFPITWGLVFTDINVLGTISTSAQALNLLENGYTTGSRAISSKYGMDRDRQVLDIDLATLVGNRSLYEGTLNYTGSTATSPAISLWCFVIVVSGTGAALTQGVSATSKFTYRTKFFDRKILLA